MQTITTVALVLATAYLVSCNNSGGHSHEQMVIELNNGQKWLVNDEMSPYILAAEKVLNDYNGDDYETLADELESQNKKLIKSCTMDGKAHDELHKWLHPHMQLIESLGDAENMAQANTIIEQLKESFNTYHTYFQ
ncbi:MAG: hypothetical protein R2766_11925 [Saprospiraceae bacterium]